MSCNLKGAYVLLLVLSEGVWISPGHLGLQYFPQGTYAYVGSAMNGLVPRLRRHFSQDKKVRWHVDYLLEKGIAYQAILLPGQKGLECSVNRLIDALPGSRVVSEGFGSSDCDCRSHLHLITPESIDLIQGLHGSRLWTEVARQEQQSA